MNSSVDCEQIVVEKNEKTDSAMVEIEETENDHYNANEEFDKRNQFISSLWQWQLNSRTSYQNMRKLLIILKSYGVDVPLSPTTLVQKVSSRADIISVPPSEYQHFGMKKN